MPSSELLSGCLSLDAMYYRLKITECVSHRHLPQWCLAIIAHIKGYWEDALITDPDSVLVRICSDINEMEFKDKRSTFRGSSIRYSLRPGLLVVRSRIIGGSDYFMVSFKPTDEAPLELLDEML